MTETRARYRTHPDRRVLHVTATGLSDDAWAVACAIGTRIVALCGFEAPAQHTVPGDHPTCAVCVDLAETTGLEIAPW